MDLPSITSYGRYKSENYGIHCLRVDFGDVSVWFSYKTAVAFTTPKTGLVVSENSWGPTTGKHLRWIEPDKSRRVKRAEFERLWYLAMSPSTDIAKD